MLATTLITFRETLEASLVVGIMLAYLDRTGTRKYKTAVWGGVVSGIAASILLAMLVRRFLGEFEGRAEELYEGVTMLLAAVLLTWMILWMLRRSRTIRSAVEHKVVAHVTNEYGMGLFLLAFVSTAREGVETVVFLNALILHTNVGMQILGGFSGIAIAVVVSYFLFRGIEILPLRKFFTVTSVLLIIFAAGLIAHSIHEFQEAGVFPFLTQTAWNTNPLLSEDGFPGSVLKSLLGYNGNPSVLEILGYVTYLSGIAIIWKLISGKRYAHAPEID